MNPIHFNIKEAQKSVEEEIDDMNRDASSTDHDIPALILKECKNNISYPVFLIWKESAVIPEDMKIQSITPIFKNGDKSDPGNYRPISLTSHHIKIFEQVIRKKLVCHLEFNSIISNKQHGFIKGGGGGGGSPLKFWKTRFRDNGRPKRYTQ